MPKCNECGGEFFIQQLRMIENKIVCAECYEKILNSYELFYLRDLKKQIKSDTSMLKEIKDIYKSKYNKLSFKDKMKLKEMEGE